jgi:hypothetical protein
MYLLYSAVARWSLRDCGFSAIWRKKEGQETFDIRDSKEVGVNTV